MGMPRPESHAPRWFAVARWTVLWLGWLWLGQQGRLAGWGWAAGTAVVAVWWALQVLAPAWPAGVSHRALGLLSALGVLGADLLPGDGARACVWLAAVPWGLWCARLHVPRSCARARGSWTWAPAWAAALAGLAVMAWPAAASGLVAGLLGACALGMPRSPARTALREPASAAGHGCGLAMGLMMGSLWLWADWCSASGLPVQAVIAAHLALMGLLAALLPTAPAARPGTHRPAPHDLRRVPLALAGPLLLLAVGLASEAWGPQALATGHALAALFAFTAYMLRWASVSLPERHTS